MATRHSYALSREPRSLPLLFLYTCSRIFKRLFGSTKAVRPMVANQVQAVRT
jgi:hypothetical protein